MNDRMSRQPGRNKLASIGYEESMLPINFGCTKLALRRVFVQISKDTCPMVAYVVFTRERMRDQDEYERYREKSRTVNANYPLKPLALYGKFEVLEGPAIEGAVILEFPSVEAATDYYFSAVYQEAVKHRFLGADYRVFIVEGLQV
jgi:uncharacterized protein (DUF1330 family)